MEHLRSKNLRHGVGHCAHPLSLYRIDLKSGEVNWMMKTSLPFFDCSCAPSLCLPSLCLPSLCLPSLCLPSPGVLIPSCPISAFLPMRKPYIFNCAIGTAIGDEVCLGEKLVIPMPSGFRRLCSSKPRSKRSCPISIAGCNSSPRSKSSPPPIFKPCSKLGKGWATTPEPETYIAEQR